MKKRVDLMIRREFRLGYAIKEKYIFIVSKSPSRETNIRNIPTSSPLTKDYLPGKKFNMLKAINYFSGEFEMFYTQGTSGSIIDINDAYILSG